MSNFSGAHHFDTSSFLFNAVGIRHMSKYICIFTPIINYNDIEWKKTH